MLSCDKFNSLSALFEVFFDSRSANRVPVRMNASVFDKESMAKFLSLQDYAVRLFDHMTLKEGWHLFNT